jgi:hypothetical protein
MGFITKEVSPLLNTKITDAGRRKISKGEFNIRYFQVGDSEINYNYVDDIRETMIINPEHNYSNSFNENNSGINYPLHMNNSINGYGIPFQNSYVDEINNKIDKVGFFDEGVKTGNQFTKNPNYIFRLSNVDGSNKLSIYGDVINPESNEGINEGDIVVLYFNNEIETIDNKPIILMYKIQDVSYSEGTSIILDRNLPDFSEQPGIGRAVFYPGRMNDKYDTIDPMGLWNESTLRFEGLDEFQENYTKIWNMNIVWKENPAGVFGDNNNVGSKDYYGSLEYFGYNNSKGHIDNDDLWFNDSFDDKINTSPDDKKSVAIIHYTNNTIDEFYGEKFSMNVDKEIGSMSSFKIHIPWIMWHKSNNPSVGQTFYVRPPNTDYYEEKYLKSYMDEDGIGMRYFNLWDDNTTPNRVGRVWPDLKIITLDDDELVMVMSAKSNRNFTLPSPKITLIDPNAFSNSTNTNNGLISDSDKTVWVTYMVNGLKQNYGHCNYYLKIDGKNDIPQDLLFKFGDEFKFMSESDIEGYNIEEIYALVQVTEKGDRPLNNGWKKIDIKHKYNDDLTRESLSTKTVIITKDDYDNASIYNYNNYINVGGDFNFGNEYFFYGSIETDIQASIYVMNYLCNLPDTQFMKTNNPTWKEGDEVYVSEIGLYDEDKELVVISKLKTPQKRMGVQQYSIKLDL